MRVALAAITLALAACAQSENIVLFPDLLSLPTMDGGRIDACPQDPVREYREPPRRVCVRFAPGSEKRVRDFYRDHMTYTARWSRARTDETILDGWILPGSPATHCLNVSVYSVPGGSVFADFALARLRDQPARMDACDWSFN